MLQAPAFQPPQKNIHEEAHNVYMFLLFMLLFLRGQSFYNPIIDCDILFGVLCSLLRFLEISTSDDLFSHGCMYA